MGANEPEVGDSGDASSNEDGSSDDQIEQEVMVEDDHV